MDDFKEISARFKKAHEADETTQPQVVDHAESFRIRAKMVGVLLLDARLKAGRSLDDCARSAAYERRADRALGIRRGSAVAAAA